MRANESPEMLSKYVTLAARVNIIRRQMNFFFFFILSMNVP